MTEIRGYVLYDGTNLYYSRYPAGWVDNLGHAYRYETRHEAKADAEIHGGRVVGVDEDDHLYA